jgi:hypothetical protein
MPDENGNIMVTQQEIAKLLIAVLELENSIATVIHCCLLIAAPLGDVKPIPIEQLDNITYTNNKGQEIQL